MNKDLLVEIFVPTTIKPGWGLIGTAYPVAKDRIVTARHVLFPPNRDRNRPIEARWHHQPRDVRRWIKIKENDIKWDGGDHYDVAVIALSFPADTGPWGALAANGPRPSDWESEGFPEAGLQEDDTRVATALGGRVHRAAKTADFFALDLNVGTDHADLWRGASGSPVMVDWMLMGVIVSCPPHFNAERLWAVPSCRLLEDPDFCKAIGHEPLTTLYDSLKAHVAFLLMGSPSAMEGLERELPMPFDKLSAPGSKQQAERLATAMFGLRLEQLIPAIRKAHVEMCKSHQGEAADAIADAANAILPAVFDRADVQTVQSRLFDGEVVLMDVPVATPTVAEILMASAEGRPAYFCKSDPLQNAPVATYRWAALPTAGMDGDYERWTQNLEKSLAEKFVDPEDDPFLQDGDRVDLIRDALDFEAGEQRTRYLVFRFRDEQDRDKARASSALLRLRQRYPALVFLDLSTESSLIKGEHKLFRPFDAILKTMMGNNP